MKKYVPRSIQNIHDRTEARNESITEKLFSEELATTFEVTIYTSLSPETQTPIINGCDSSNNSNYYFCSARSKAGHHDHLVFPESANTRDEYEKFRNAHFQAVTKKTDDLPTLGDVWIATYNGGNLVTLVSLQRQGTIITKFKEDGPAKNAHSSSEEPTLLNEDYGPPYTPPEAPAGEIAQEIIRAYPVVSAALANKIVEVANNLGTNPYWLANLINFETAFTFDPKKENALGYTGLIQFGTTGRYATIKDLGITKEYLKSRTAVEQMDIVEQYFKLPHKRNGSEYKNVADLYMAVFYPAAVGKSLDFNIAEDWASKDSRNRPASYFSSPAVNPGIVTVRDYVTKANNNAKLPTGL